MTLPPKFRSGDIIRMSTTDGELVAQLVDLGDPDQPRFNWDWPICPLDYEFDEDGWEAASMEALDFDD